MPYKLRCNPAHKSHVTCQSHAICVSVGHGGQQTWVPRKGIIKIVDDGIIVEDWVREREINPLYAIYEPIEGGNHAIVAESDA